MNGGTRTVSLTGNDTIVIAGRVLIDLADENNVELTFPNELMSVKTGKNGNSIYAFNATGRQCDVKINAIRGSADDRFLNELLQQMIADTAAFPLLEGQLVKRTGDGFGNITNDTYIVSGGVFTKQPGATSNVSGDTTQAVVSYELKFTNAQRAIF